MMPFLLRGFCASWEVFLGDRQGRGVAAVCRFQVCLGHLWSLVQLHVLLPTPQLTLPAAAAPSDALFYFVVSQFLAALCPIITHPSDLHSLLLGPWLPCLSPTFHGRWPQGHSLLPQVPGSAALDAPYMEGAAP